MATRVLYDIPSDAPVAQCTGPTCGAPIVWLKTPAGKNMPVDAEGDHRGEPHWASCADRQRFARERPSSRPWPGILFVAYRGRELKVTREDLEARALLARGWNVQRYAHAPDGWPEEGAPKT